jgi:exopolysaccharide biosynthesis polyprenyl glycosylphosphotransferase
MQPLASNTNALLETPLTLKIYQASRNVPRIWQWRLFFISLGISDVIMLGIGFRLAYYVRFELSLPIFHLEANPSFRFYQFLVLGLIATLLLIFKISGLYEKQNLLGGTREYSLIFNSVTMGMFVVISAGFLFPEFILARAWLLLAWGFAFFFTALGRFLLRRGVYYLRQYGYFLSPAVVVGANDEGLSLAGQLLRWKSSGIHVLGFVDKKLPVGTPLLEHLHVLGKVDQLDQIVKQYDVEEIILASSAITSRDKMLDIFKQYGVDSRVNVRMSSGLYEIITTGLTVKDFAYVPLVGVNPVRLTGIDRVLKMALDYGLTIPGLILISPMLLIIAIAIRLESPGSVIHRRRVMGVNGREFDAYKFRTMRIEGDEILAAHPELQAELTESYKIKDDPRVTRVGRFLRKFSLDELAQLFNVLKGEMSLVGPRMISPGEIDNYDQWDINLLTVRPGLTGLWQVSGRSDVPYDERVRLDMQYIRNWSIWLDLQLLLRTIPAVIRGRGAY